MTLKVIATGTASDIYNIGDYDAQFNEGDYQVVDLNLDSPPADWVINEIQEQLLAHGATLTQDIEKRDGGKTLRIHAQTNNPFLIILAVVLATALAAAIIIIATMISWAIYKVVNLISALGPWGWIGLAAFGMVVVGGVAAYGITRRNRREE
jgi:hypothetical protein